MLAASIIIPTYKRFEQTQKTIDCLLKSEGLGDTFSIEIIVSDGTPDTSLQKYLSVVTSSVVQYLYTKPKKTGIASSKNHGARYAQHPILIFCDSDIEVEKDTLKNSLVALQKHMTVAGLSGQVHWKTGKLDGKQDRPSSDDRFITINQTTYTEAIFSRYFVTYRDIFWSLGGYDEVAFNMHGEGSDLSTRYWRAGYPLAHDKSIRVYHIYDAPDSAAMRISHPEKGIAKDFLLLAYKFNMLENDYPNFSKVLKVNFDQFAHGYVRLLQGIGLSLDVLVEANSSLTAFREIVPKYDFKFLEIFHDESLFKKCIAQSINILKAYRDKVFII